MPRYVHSTKSKSNGTRASVRNVSPQPGSTRSASASASASSSSASSRLDDLSSQVSALRSLSSVLVERQNFGNQVSGAGFSFYDTTTGTWKRNLYKALGYPTKITAQDYRERYERGDIAERIVEAYPRGTWSRNIAVQEDPDPEITTPFEEAVAAFFRRHSIWSTLLRADILANLGRYSVILIGADGDPSTPLPQLSSDGSILYLRPYSEERADIQKEVTDPTDPRFGLPEAYSIKLGAKTSQSKVYHWTRVLHVVEGALDNDVYGKPRLRSIWNRLNDLDKLVGGGSEAAWKRMDPGTMFDLDPELELDATALDALEEEIEEFWHGFRRYGLTRGVTPKVLQAAVFNFSSNADSVLKFISATTGIPIRILTGSERGELASSQDRSNWADRVFDRRSDFGEPLVRQLIQRFVEYGALPEPSTDDYEVVWPDIDELNEEEKATVAKTLADTNEAQAKAGGGIVYSADEIRDRVHGMEPREDAGVDDQGESGEADDDEPGDDSDDDTDVDTLRLAESRLAESFDLTDSPPNEPEWKAVHRAADANIEPFTEVILGIFDEVRASLTDEVIEEGISNLRRTGDLGVLRQAISAAFEAQTPTLTAWINILVNDGGEAASRSVRARGSFIASAVSAPILSEIEPGVLEGIVNGQRLRAVLTEGTERSGVYWRLYVNGEPRSHFRKKEGVESFARKILSQEGAVAAQYAFDSVNPRALSFAETRSSLLIQQISAQTRDTVKSLIAEGIRDGIPPRSLSQSVRRSVGLRTDQVRAVDNLYNELSGAKPGQIIERFPPRPGIRTQAGFRVRVPKRGLSLNEVAEHTARYRKMQHNYRSRVIARTETLRSSNEGQRELWRQAKDDGRIPNDVLRVWITTPDSRLREEHAELEGATAPVDGDFEAGIEPGEEPLCRCGQGLIAQSSGK